jgi:DNA-binding NarL/FixJ family response regulator
MKQARIVNIPAPNAIGISLLVVNPSQKGCDLLVGALAQAGCFEKVIGVRTVSAAKMAAKSEAIDVALISSDIRQGSERAFDLIRALGALSRPVRSVVIARQWHHKAVIEAFTNGAKGIFTQSDQELWMLCKALICVHMGQVWANSEQLNLTLDYFAGNASNEPSVVDMPSSLSGREKEIAGLLMQGSSNKEIARALHISERTVKNHMGNIFEKIGVNGRVQAVLRLVGGI